MTNKNHNSGQRFAICINTDDPDLVTPRMVYQVLPDESAIRSNYLRIIDNEGEDYLYPSKYFVLVDFPQPAQRALLRTKVPIMRSVTAKASRSTSAARKSL